MLPNRHTIRSGLFHQAAAKQRVGLAQACLAEDNLEQADEIGTALVERHPKEPLSLSLKAVVCALRKDLEGFLSFQSQALAGVQAEAHPHHVYHMIALGYAANGLTSLLPSPQSGAVSAVIACLIQVPAAWLGHSFAAAVYNRIAPAESGTD